MSNLIQRPFIGHSPTILVDDRYYPTYPGQKANAALTTVDVLYTYPFYNAKVRSVDRMAFRVTTGGAGSAIKSGLYANNPATMRANGAPLVADNTGQASTASSTIEHTISLTLGVDFYWVGFKFTGTAPQLNIINTAEMLIEHYLGIASIGNNPVLGFTTASVYSADMPTLSGATSWTEATNVGMGIARLRAVV